MNSTFTRIVTACVIWLVAFSGTLNAETYVTTYVTKVQEEREFVALPEQLACRGSRPGGLDGSRAAQQQC